MDSLRSMGIFVRVAERGSFSKAAADLNLSHGMASAVVKDLETRHGIELIRRTTRRMTLTPEGRHFYERARRIIDDVAELEESLARDKARVTGRLVVQAPVALSRIILAPALGGFLAAYPEIRWTLLSRDNYPDMIAADIDALVYVGPMPDSTLVTRSLGRFAIVTAAAPAYLERRGRPKTPDDLADHDLINITSATSGRALDWRFKVNGKTVLRPMRTNIAFESSEAAIAAAVGGAGILQNISYALTDRFAAGRLKPLLSKWREDGPEVHLVTRKYQVVPPRLRVFASFLQEIIRARQKTDAAILPRAA